MFNAMQVYEDRLACLTLEVVPISLRVVRGSFSSLCSLEADKA